MSLETRLRNTGIQGGPGGGGSGSGTVNTGSAGYLAYYPAASAAVSPSAISTSTGSGVAPLNFQALTTQIAASVTGDFWILNSAGNSIFANVAGTNCYTFLSNTDGTVWRTLKAGSSVSIASDGTNIYITAITNAGASSSGRGYLQMLPQQAKLYSNTSAARIDAGTPTWRLLFSPTTQQYGQWQFICPPDYSSNPYVRIIWSSDSSLAVAKTVTWLVDQWGMADGQSGANGIYTDTYGGANTFSVALSAGYSSGTIMINTIPLATTVSFGASRLIDIRLSSSAGIVTGNQEMVGMTLEYTR